MSNRRCDFEEGSDSFHLFHGRKMRPVHERLNRSLPQCHLLNSSPKPLNMSNEGSESACSER